jgi:hypothetical protein
MKRNHYQSASPPSDETQDQPFKLPGWLHGRLIEARCNFDEKISEE